MTKREIATKYRQNDQWVVSYWSSDNKCWRLTGSMSYHQANEFIKELRNTWNGRKQCYIDDY